MTSAPSRQIGSVFARLLLAFFVLAIPAVASAMPITKSLTVNVFDVCSSGGTGCASTGPSGDAYFAAEVNKIWAQAGIEVNFNFVSYVDNNTFNGTITTSGSSSYANLFNWTATNVIPLYTNTDYLFLVHTISTGGGTTFGLTSYTGPGYGAVEFIAMDTIMSPSWNRIDTIAHELGHALGLDPTSDPEYNSSTLDTGHSSNANELMASGSYRHIPSNLANIAPNGSNYDQLSNYQIAYARQSLLLTDVAIPEPETLVLVFVGIVAAGTVRRARFFS